MVEQRSYQPLVGGSIPPGSTLSADICFQDEYYTTTMDVVNLLRSETPFIFVKFGDGEYFAAVNAPGGNCDGTPYTQTLGNRIHDSIKTLAVMPHAFIGKWVDSPQVSVYFQSLCGIPIRWENYTIFIFRTHAEYYTRCLPMYQAIKNSTQQKIYVCNDTMVDGTRSFLNIDAYVVVDRRNWFETSYQTTLDSLKSMITTQTPIILTSAGMGAKPLITEIATLYPAATIIDIGSALDLVCSSRRTRDYHVLTNSETDDIRASLA